MSTTNIMLVATSQPKFLERIFVSADGHYFRMVFLVAMVNGELKGRLVSVRPIGDQFRPLELEGQTSDVSDILCLPIECSDKEPSTEYVPAFTPVVSPYTELFFFNSQPTRAPSHN